MLSGLPDEQVETLIAQLKINKEFGFLKSDIWDNPDRIRKEFFHRRETRRGGDAWGGLAAGCTCPRWRWWRSSSPAGGVTLLEATAPTSCPRPPPSSPGFGEVVRSGEIWRHTGASLSRILVGFGGAVVRRVCSWACRRSCRAPRAASSTTSWPSSTPPRCSCGSCISIIWFGLSHWAPIFTTFMITLPVVASNLVEGVANVDRRLLEMGDVYRLCGRQKFRAIVVPSTLPYLVAGMKVGFGLALKVSVVAEIFGVTSGIGYIMNYSREILATQMVFVWALVMILVMIATDKLVFDTALAAAGAWR